MSPKNKTNKILILNLGSTTIKGSIFETQENENFLIQQFSKKI